MEKNSSKSIVYFDNSSYAGVLRLKEPELEVCKNFNLKYPKHIAIDQLSLAEFLTAICLFDEIRIESSSIIHSRGLKEKALFSEVERRVWASFQDEIAEAINFEAIRTIDLNAENDKTFKLAYDIYCSPFKKKLKLPEGLTLPDVYTSHDYIFRDEFMQINRSEDHQLTNEDLTEAMFLHRGLLLQKFAHIANADYIPYLYRGEMLSSIPPFFSIDFSDNFSARLPLAQGTRPKESEYMMQLNKFYYELLNTVSWVTYNDSIPFIGSAILAKAEGSIEEAFSIAAEYRNSENWREQWRDLRSSYHSANKPAYERKLETIKKELVPAANHLCADIGAQKIGNFYKLATFWVPSGIQKVIEELINFLPVEAKLRASLIANNILNKTPLQLMFTEHAAKARENI